MPTAVTKPFLSYTYYHNYSTLDRAVELLDRARGRDESEGTNVRTKDRYMPLRHKSAERLRYLGLHINLHGNTG